MKKRSLIRVLALLASTGAAFAADLDLRREAPLYDSAPEPPVWTGFYLGLNAGGTWSNSTSVLTQAGLITVDPPGTASPEPADLPRYVAALSGSGAASSSQGGSFLGGLTLGYNKESEVGGAHFVSGFEADIQGAAGGSPAAATQYGQAQAPSADYDSAHFLIQTRNNATLDYLGTLRGRVGWLATPRLLLFGGGGLAYGGVNFASRMTTVDVSEPILRRYAPAAVTASSSSLRAGWTAGGGIEWMIQPNWSAKIEYLYYDLGTTRTNTGIAIGSFAPALGFSGPGYALSAAASTRFNGNIVRAGVNYHIDAVALPLLAAAH